MVDRSLDYRPLAGLVGTLAALCLSLLSTSVVLAHAELLEAAPEPGRLFTEASPSEVRLRFSQEIEELSIVVLDEQFREVQQGEAQLDPQDPSVALVALPRLESGTYTVNWRTRSVDSHPLEGSYRFAVDYSLPRGARYTRIIALVVFALMALLVYVRRERPERK